MSNPAPGFRDRPDHKITIEPHAGRVVIRAGGRQIAASERAQVLKEASYPPVFYIPFADIDFSELEATDSSTRCPFKGMASYWRLKSGAAAGDAMWAYLTPYDEMLQIADHGAFYPSRVEIVAEDA